MTDSTSANGADQRTIDNELRGALFVNNKGDNPRRPDFRGRCTIDGKEFRMSGWKRKAVQSGQEFISLSFTPEAVQPESEIQVTHYTTDDFTPASEATGTVEDPFPAAG